MKEVIIATGPLVGKANMTLAYRVVLTAYYDGDKVTKYATHRQSFDKGVSSKSDGRYFEGYHEPDAAKLRARALSNFLERVADTVTVAEKVPTLQEVMLVQALDAQI